jgi:hypothetical protein
MGRKKKKESLENSEIKTKSFIPKSGPLFDFETESKPDIIEKIEPNPPARDFGSGIMPEIIPEAIPSVPEVIPELPVQEPGITMNEYLTNYSQRRGLDVVFTNWMKRKDPTNPLKLVEEWDKLIDKFLNEVV